MSNPDWFHYKIVWIKSRSTNFLNAKKQPLRRHEDICIFYASQPQYNPQLDPGKPYDKGLRKDNRSGSYNHFGTRHIQNITGYRLPSDVLFIPDEHNPDWIYQRTAESEGAYHSCQKPVPLGRWLIRTYTNAGEIVLDNACGSGSFLVAAKLEGRRYIGIEKNDNSVHFGKQKDFIGICHERLKGCTQQQLW